MPARRTVGATLENPAATEIAQLRLEVQRLQRQVEEHARLNASLSDAAEQFTRALAHDVKNPLAAIKLCVQGVKRAMQRGAVLDEEYLAERLDRIEHAVAQVLEQIADARTRAAGQAAPPRQPLRIASLDLAAMVGEMVERLRSQAGPNRLRLECSQRTLIGRWDEGRLRRAFGELIDNALKFSAASEPVAIRLSQDGEAAEIIIADHGIGIPERDLPYVGSRFYRGENVIGCYKGAGTGLHEARLAIEEHGGQLSIRGDEGRGSTVSVRLPL